MPSSWPRSLRPGALELFDAIPESYCVGAPSNMSAVHWDRITEMELAARFTRSYLSYKTGHLKPAPEGFYVAMRDMGLAPSEVLFFDDLEDNVRMVRGLGIDGRLAQGPRDVMNTLLKYGTVQWGT